MFHNVLMTNLTPLCQITNTNELHGWDNRPFNSIWPEVKQEKTKEINLNKTIKKKSKRNRTMFTTEQIRLLENVFVRSKYIDIEKRRELAACLKMDQKCVKVWFQNRRMKEKRALSESSDSASESVVESTSPPLESSQLNQADPADSTTVQTCFHPSVNYYVRPNYYCASNNYVHDEAKRNNHAYESPINCEASPVYADLNNFKTGNCLGQYYQPQANINYFYNTGYGNNQRVAPYFNVVDWA